MTFYQYVHFDQSEPGDIGFDSASRIVFRFSILAHKVKSQTFGLELVGALVRAGVGAAGGVAAPAIFLSSAAQIPAGNGPWLMVVEGGGMSPQGTQNTKRPGYNRPSASISVHAKVRSVGLAMAQAAYDALADIVNTDVIP